MGSVRSRLGGDQEIEDKERKRLGWLVMAVVRSSVRRGKSMGRSGKKIN